MSYEVLDSGGLYKGADKSLARPDVEFIAAAKTWLDGQLSEFFFEWLANVRAWSL